MRDALVLSSLSLLVVVSLSGCLLPVDGPPGTTDAGYADAGRPDASGPGPSDAATPTACEAAGGVCVSDPVTSCPTGVIGTPERFSCGAAVSCCLPRSTPPVCDHVGELTEGWYSPTGARMCAARCGGAIATCMPSGASGAGWYAPSDATGCASMGPVISLQPCAR